LQKMKSLAGRRQVEVAPEAVNEIIRLQRRFSPYSGMPGRPIRFLESILLGMSELPVLPKKKKGKTAQTESGTSASSNALPVAIDREMVLKQFCTESGLPPFMVDPALPMDVSALRKSFNANVFGQERAVDAVVDMLATVKTALTRTGKPIASFLFAGPTGVGKTELAKVLAQTMFSSRERILRFDMSEYSSPWSVLRLIGEGYYAEGLLTSAVRRDPFCVLLFDEIEKADPKFYELLLQILSEGRLTDSRGRVVNFCSAIIIMTTNIGAANLHRNRISWKKELGEKDVTQHFTSAIEQHFRPELYNRMDAIVAFAPLDQATVRFVVEREIELLRKREGVQFRHVDLNIEEAVYQHLAEVGYDARFGARYLQRAIRERLLVPLAEALNGYAYDERLSVQATIYEGKIKVAVDADPLGFDLLMEQWDKLTLAEKTSHQRRKTALLLESPLYLRFQSEIDVLESDKTKLGEAFWKQGEQAKRHAALSGVQGLSLACFEKIQEMEVEIALACMGQGDFNTDFGLRLEAWESEFFQMQIKLHELIFPKRNGCRLGIYGAQLDKLLAFYLAICKLKNFEVKSVDTVWYREGYRPEDGNEEVGEPKTKEKETTYLLQRLQNPGAKNFEFKPPQPNDLLCGLEMELSGPCAWLYLKDEKGFVHINTPEANGGVSAAAVLTSMVKLKTPNDIHRQSYYQGSKAKRVIGMVMFTDHRLGIQSHLPFMENVPGILEKLDELFKDAVTRAFLDNEPEE
ncbi:MAG: AAA family ATPase, partial [Saprospiraceae bacterium]|nr:AAA family ATPase [Saprospiraceae bacterium]